MRQFAFLLTIAVAALVFAAGCQKQSAEDQSKKAEQDRAQAHISNFDPFKDPAVRKTIEADPAQAEKYKNELEAAKLPGAEPGLAPAATTESAASATSAASAMPAESAASAASAAPAAPAAETPAAPAAPAASETPAASAAPATN